MGPSGKIEAPSHGHHQSFWLWVMCLTGVDYFSTLGYQPSIAFEATGVLTPFATVILVLVTLLGAFPVYAHVARKSHTGQGSIAMLERLMHGWYGKLLVLMLLGFAATDFVITKTLSAADATVHLVENPFFPSVLKFPQAQMVWTMLLLILLGAMFMRGFKEVIGMAVVIVVIYLTLNALVVGSSLYYLSEHPDALGHWYDDVVQGNWHFEHNPLSNNSSWWNIGAVCLLLFPKLALGLSGFETGVAVMPLIKGRPGDDPAEPKGRIRNTRKLLLTAALIMSVYLLCSALVTSTLIAPDDLRHGPAANRALAYLAHGGKLSTGQMGIAINRLFGEGFGTVYDISTIVILWFAGASAMAGLLNLVPQYLPRYGMAPEWTKALRPLVILFTFINLFVTWRFDASVEQQGAAYATGVLVLMSSACIATLIDKYRTRTGSWMRRLSWYYLVVTFVFVYTTLVNVFEKPDGLKIATWFILAIVVSSVISRLMRSKELRFHGFSYADEQSRFLWDSMKHLEFPVLVPHRPGGRTLSEKEAIIRREHHLGADIPVVFIEATLGDASDFYNTPQLSVSQESDIFVLKVTRCASIAHTIAALALELCKVGVPPEIHFGWSAESPMAATISFLLFGEGNVPWIVRELVVHAEPNPDKQPRIVIG